jgi:hypothetical protein
MKNLKYIKSTGFIILLCFVAFSCTTSKKMAISCPVPASQHKNIAYLNHPRSFKKYQVVSPGKSRRSNSKTKYTARSSEGMNMAIYSKDGLNKQTTSTGPERSAEQIHTDITGDEAILYASLNNSLIPVEKSYPPDALPGIQVVDYGDTYALYERTDISLPEPLSKETRYSGYGAAILKPSLNGFTGIEAQDTLYLKNGTKVAGKRIRKSGQEYWLQSPNGMPFVFDADSVEKIVRKGAGATKVQSQESYIRKTNSLSVAGFLSNLAGLLSLTFLGDFGYSHIFPFCTLAGLIMTIVAWRRMKKNPGQYKGKGWAIGGLFLGVAGLIAAALIGLYILASI